MTRLTPARALLFVLLVSSSSADADVLTMLYTPQEQDQWSWTGVTASILAYHGKSQRQCAIAEFTRTHATWHDFGSVDCCVSARDGCNYPNLWISGQPGSLQDILSNWGLTSAGKPASPCLASRIPHGTRITRENLSQVERAEAVLRSLGFPELRVRHHGETARIEVPLQDLPRLFKPQVREAAVAGLTGLGFRWVTLDLGGLQMVCANFNSNGRNASSLARLSIEKEYLKGNYQPRTCRQCADPPCLKTCPVTALQVDRQTGTYPRVIDERVCIGCQKCVKACYQYFRPSRSVFDLQRKRAIKCHLCFGEPQCVKFCPLGVLRLERSEKGFLVGYPLTTED